MRTSSAAEARGGTRPIVLGLTGSIGMGKSTAAAMLRRLGIPVHDADAAVHAMLQPGGEAEAAVAAEFPEVMTGTGIDRRALGNRVFANRAALRRLERILHPRVRRAAERFIRRHRLRRTPVVVLDIPLLFETRGERLCDAVIVVSAPPFVQARRVLRRPGMTQARMQEIRRQQLPDPVKRARADHVIETGLGHGEALRQLRAILHRLPVHAGRCGQGER
ncbi:dephospho-CoA kinase [Limimonas halophila]|uniref:Dephospho-CoA kinase n=1 Tax=Limimonas halophila TaxID=1082479 RepID=A0A1G7SM09_9PROT|nr:dephospho-CoA kinase [Limimonas halophila]SDG24095.1 dephospho-CoA kinase [Limimonas halophila]